MKFLETPLNGAFIIEPTPINDNRGFLAIAFNDKAFEEQGLCGHFVQTNLSYNRKKATLRGLHSQKKPHEEVKLVRCVKGAIWDVIVDIRPNSPTHCQWFGVELNVENRQMLYIPTGFLHGFITLQNDCEVLYQVNEHYQPGAESSARYDDPAFNIQWPLKAEILSEKDRAWPPFAVPVA